MARRNRREPTPEPGEFKLGGFRKIETHPDGDWAVTRVTGSAATKAYRCPGCDMEIKPATPHVVAWPYYGDDIESSLPDRRHWHTTCWANRLNRRPRTR